MKRIGVGVFKTRFSEILREVRGGERVAIEFGRKKEVVAFLVPPEPKQTGRKRKLGILNGKASFEMLPGFKMSEEEFLGGFSG